MKEKQIQKLGEKNCGMLTRGKVCKDGHAGTELSACRSWQMLWFNSKYGEKVSGISKLVYVFKMF